MRFAEYDYQGPDESEKHPEMAKIWDAHWRGRTGLKDNLGDEPLWPTVRDHLREPGRLLEAGCGTGQWVQFLGTLGHDVVGVDYALSGLEIGRAHNPNLHLMQGDFRSLSFKDESFDYVVSFGAIEHDINGPTGALREFLRVLKPGGKLMCSVPCLNLYRTLGYPWLVVRRWLKCRRTLRRLWGKTTPFTFHQYIWSPKAYKAILAQCGWRVLDLRGYGTTLTSRSARFCDTLVRRIDPLSSAHMMMAICVKQSRA